MFTKTATQNSIDEVIKSWLRTACDRKKSDGTGGRKRKIPISDFARGEQHSAEEGNRQTFISDSEED